jgi:hypothetical protein
VTNSHRTFGERLQFNNTNTKCTLILIIELILKRRKDIFAAGISDVDLTTGVIASNNDFVAGKPKFDTSPSSISVDPLFVNSTQAFQYNGNDILILKKKKEKKGRSKEIITIFLWFFENRKSKIGNRKSEMEIENRKSKIGNRK